MIKVLFFGSIADMLGQRERLLPAGEGMTLADVLKAVACADFKPLLVAVNQTQVNDMHRLVKAGDEVALMPPFSGG
ncbi:MAG: MoaD/ThiS family protein [Mariprofundus sp.]|nr:MoaD/ThiS family protein [Mariprofundus sp.]